MKKFTQIIDQQKALELTSTEKPKLTLCLTMDERTKSRLKVALSDGQEAGLFLLEAPYLKRGIFCCQKRAMLSPLRRLKSKYQRFIVTIHYCLLVFVIT